MERAIVLLSGGLDSTTTLAIAKAEGFDLYALSFDYQQRHRCELDCAKRIAATYQVQDHLVVAFDLTKIGGSALTSRHQVPKTGVTDGIPSTYVPARNTIFLSFAAAWAEVVGAFDIFIGANVVDYSGYPDCRPDYLAAYTQMINLGTRVGRTTDKKFTIHAPLLKMSKVEIIKKGLALGVDYGGTHSCYDPSRLGDPCGLCDSCRIRRGAFAALGIPDPVDLRKQGQDL